MPSPCVLWFRGGDLRTHDNAALNAAAASGRPILPIYIHSTDFVPDEVTEHSAAAVWLQAALADVSASIVALAGVGDANVGLRFFKAEPGSGAAGVVSELLRVCASVSEGGGPVPVYFNRRYEPESERLVKLLQQRIAAAGRPISLHSFPGYLLFEPDAVISQITKDGKDSGGWRGHWGTLMPFVTSCKAIPGGGGKTLPSRPPSAPLNVLHVSATLEKAMGPLPMSCLGLSQQPANEDWGAKILSSWNPTESGAHDALELFIASSLLEQYETSRSRVDRPSVSRLSPFLRFGQITPRQVQAAVRSRALPASATKTFDRRLHWRDLAYFHLKVFPEMATQPIRAHYKHQRWSGDPVLLRRWKRGQTGFPMVDAAMRELWATGWMHQSARMIAASFLTEYLNINWVEGAKWFMYTLLDADPAINAMMWQNAGRSGIDQWNFVMSPVNASQDPTGGYVRKWCPELAALNNKLVHAPWLANKAELAASSVALVHFDCFEPCDEGSLGQYPTRCIEDLAASRQDTVQAVLDMRRLTAADYNDAGGYDIIKLPFPCPVKVTRVFTKQEFRIDSTTGAVKPPPTPRATAHSKPGSRSNPPAKSRGKVESRQMTLDSMLSLTPGKGVVKHTTSSPAASVFGHAACSDHLKQGIQALQKGKQGGGQASFSSERATADAKPVTKPKRQRVQHLFS